VASPGEATVPPVEYAAAGPALATADAQGFLAYDMQKIKGYAHAGLDDEPEQRASILGALALYLDFINLFIYLLRIFGQRR
jgi:hypothetical protein